MGKKGSGKTGSGGRNKEKKYGVVSKNQKRQNGSGVKSYRGDRNGNSGLVVANMLTHQQLLASEVCKPLKLGLYSKSDDILLVGEGNFTFAAALCTKLGGSKILATSLDSKRDVLDKYTEVAEKALSTIIETGGRVEHSVDATNDSILRKVVKNERFDKIIFNFPHCGGATQEDIEKNRSLIKDFLVVAKLFLRPSFNAEIHISLRDTGFYNSWDVPTIVKEADLKLKRKVPLKLEEFAELGYLEARTNPAFREAPSTEKAITYIIRPKIIQQPKKIQQ